MPRTSNLDPAVVRAIVEKRNGGKRFATIAAELNASGALTPTGTRWSEQNVRAVYARQSQSPQSSAGPKGAVASPDFSALVAWHTTFAFRPLPEPEPEPEDANLELETADRKTERFQTSLVTSLVPSRRYLASYVSRVVGVGADGDPLHDLAMLESHRAHGEHVLLEGPTGAAKTTVANALGAKLGVPVLKVACNGAVEPSSLFGSLVPCDNGEIRFVRGPLFDVASSGGILLLDEVNFLRPAIAAVLHGLLDAGRSITVPGVPPNADGSPATIRAADGFFCIATMNPGYAGTTVLNEAFRNRFVVYDWQYDPAVERSLCRSETLVTWAEESRANSDIRQTPISTNSLMAFEAHLTRFGWPMALKLFGNRFRHLGERTVVVTSLGAIEANVCRELGISESAESVAVAESVAEGAEL